ncbi:recombination-associated protein RdgC, partial [Tibeticola sp.]
MFKNLSLYRCDADAARTPLAALEDALEPARFAPCAPTQEKAVGWIEPRGQAHGPLVESVAG